MSERDLANRARTSQPLRQLVAHARAGAHVVLRGDLGDDLLVNGKILTWSWGIAEALGDEAGIEYVFIANQADGVYCLDEDREESAGEFFADLAAAQPDDAAAALGDGAPRAVAGAVRLLLRQEERPVAVLLEDAAQMFSVQDETTRGALGILLEAAREAADMPGPAGPRNLLVAHGSPDGPAVEAIAALPDVHEATVEAPSFDERLIALRDLGRSFHHGANGGRPEERDLRTLATLTGGEPLRSLVQLSRSSRLFEIPARRPETLYRTAHDETTLTPLGRIGVDSVMARIGSEVRGQDDALARIRERLELGVWRAANRPPGAQLTRPMATLVLHGPPGVGKTETALILAESMLGSRTSLRRFDCSEIHSRHDLARLVGAPPGYVGYEQGGALTEALEQEAAVILFDEFDRAEGLAETLLGILDAGRLTDGRGRTATFENAILIFTTNLGFRDDEPLYLPGTEPTGKEFVEASEARVKAEIKHGKLSSPALWSRMQEAMVGFNRLGEPALGAIAEDACGRLERNLGDEYGIELRLIREELLPAVVVAATREEGWDGRTAFRAVQSQLEVPVRNELAAMNGGRGPRSGATVVLGHDGVEVVERRRGRVRGRRPTH